MSGAHTPGPWTVIACDGNLSIDAEPRGMLCAIRYLGNASERVKEQESNARLIAAAPDLLTALERLLDDSELCGHMLYDQYREARVAIAKATGEIK